MIYIDRTSQDENGHIIQPDEDWFELANSHTPGRNDDIDRSIYAHSEVKKALEKLFRNKCAYCESPLPETDWDVEHFRPKNAVEEVPDHPGYYWLAYVWSNLYPSCVSCNQIRRDQATWEQPQEGETGGKGTQFPLADETTRAWSPDDDLMNESRLLLDPCSDRPERHLVYGLDGTTLALKVDGEDDTMGDKSIEVFNWKRKRLKNRLRDRIAFVTALLKALPKTANSLPLELLASIFADKASYAGAARYVASDPAAFGISEELPDWLAEYLHSF